MSLSFMSAGNKITIQSVSLDNSSLPSVLIGAIGNSSPDKLLEVMKSYVKPNYEIFGAFKGNVLLGVLGICQADAVVTILHVSVLEDFQRQGIGTLLLDEVKKRCKSYRILAETDEESRDFYAKLGFTCEVFKGKWGNVRYKCECKLRGL